MTLARDLNIDAVIAGEHRLSREDAVRLYREASLHDLGRWADAVCRRIHGDNVRTFIKDRNVNYTNVCSARCTFCAFRRDDGDDDAYVLDMPVLRSKLQELVDVGGFQVLLQGGMHPGLPLSWYEDMLRELKAEFPQVHLHAFSPPEFVEFVACLDIDGFPTPGVGRAAELSDETFRAKLDVIMQRLVAAGLDSIPGGGGEIFAEHVRRRIGIGKATADQWLEVMAAGHRAGLLTSATMMFGHIEGVADRVDHMLRVRDWQDRAINEGWPGKYLSFISWPFQRENTPLGRVRDWDPDAAAGEGDQPGEPFPGDALADGVYAGLVDGDSKPDCDRFAPRAGKRVRLAGASEYLRTQAISRLFLDNIHSIGASWVTMGPRIGQVALAFGANDMGSIMMEENVVSAAGTTYCLDEPVLCHLIRDAGFTPAVRDNAYRIVQTHDGSDAPDLQVTDWSQHRAKALHHEKPEEEIPANADVALTISGDTPA
ncbi:MAG: radical SAM protein [Planctomycetota bacterium]